MVTSPVKMDLYQFFVEGKQGNHTFLGNGIATVFECNLYLCLESPIANRVISRDVKYNYDYPE